MHARHWRDYCEIYRRRNLFRLGSTNHRKNIQPLDIFWWGAKLTKKLFFKYFWMCKYKYFLSNFFLQKCAETNEICGMCSNEWKINFTIFIFRLMVIFVLKIHRKLTDFDHKIDHISKTCLFLICNYIFQIISL